MSVVYPKELVSDKEWVFFSNESSINHLEEGVNSTLIKFVDDSKMGGAATTYIEVRQKACDWK